MKRKFIIVSAIIIPALLFVLIKNVSFQKEVSIGDVLRENGFVELKPPSTLVPPGTWMTVLSTNPFCLSIICPPENSLGLNASNRLQTSFSTSSKMMSKLRNKFHVGSELLSRIQGNMSFAEVKSVSFQLKNIRIVEIPDDVVIAGLRNRALPCRDAIRFRTERKEAVSMVKSVLMADVDYQVEFKRDLKSNTQAELKKKVALELDGRLASDQEGSRTIVGRNLIWGIREDANLAKLGIGLPPTGGSEKSADVFGGKGPVESITLEQIRQKFPPEDRVVAHDVLPIRQPSPMSCWATVYAMMKSWKLRSPLSVKSAVAGLGAPWDDYYLKEKGLPAGKEKEFVKAIGMRTEPPANYTIAAYVEMLQQRGPLWIITGDGISSHARLLIAVYGPWKAEGIKAYQETVFEFIDPSSGTYQYESGLQFAEKFEREARWLVDGKFDDIELREQILSW
jgi:hypothetical protein